MKLISIIMLVVLAAFGISFAILNSQSVTLNYYLGVRDISLPLLLVSTFSIGAIFGFFLATPTMLRLRRGKSKLKSEIKQAQKDLQKVNNG